jgi:hypothetical protein
MMSARTNQEGIMKPSNFLIFLALLATGLVARPALADCTPGETRCGTYGEMEGCNNDHKWDTQPNSKCERSIPNRPQNEGRYNYNEGGRGKTSDGSCTQGITRCGADGKVERCTEFNTWKTDPGSNCNR